MKLGTRHKKLLSAQPRAIVHMRRQLENQRFGLIFGAGLSQDLGIPNWAKLVELIAADPSVKGKKILETVPPRAGLPYQTEMLFEHYKKQRCALALSSAAEKRRTEYSIGADWREIVRCHRFNHLQILLSASPNADNHNTYLYARQRSGF